MAIGSSSPAPAWARAAVIAGGAAVALAMVLLGLWQMQVFEERGDRVAAERAAAAPVGLVERIPRGGEVGDVFGRRVEVAGQYVADQQVVVVDADGTRRLLAGLALPDGRVVPVVRGMVSAAELPPVPVGVQRVTGVFLPSEPGETRPVAAEQLPTVRLPALAQRWPQQLAPGFVTLDAELATAQGLSPAAVRLPDETGTIRNLGYALQWWVFAVFALGFSGVMARSMRPHEAVPTPNSSE